MMPPQQHRPVVTLSKQEWRFAANVGLQRHIQARERNIPQAENGYSKHVQGACAEMAVAKWLNCYWIGALVDDPRENNGDVQPGLEVRSTANPTGRLIIVERDPDHNAFVLAIGEPPEFELVGWAYASDARRLVPFKPIAKDSVAAWALPQGQLRPMSELRALIALRPYVSK